MTGKQLIGEVFSGGETLPGKFGDFVRAGAPDPEAEADETFEKALASVRDTGGRFVRRERVMAAAADDALAARIRESIKDFGERLAFDQAVLAAAAYMRALGMYEEMRRAKYEGA